MRFSPYWLLTYIKASHLLPALPGKTEASPDGKQDADMIRPWVDAYVDSHGRVLRINPHCALIRNTRSPAARCA